MTITIGTTNSRLDTLFVGTPPALLNETVVIEAGAYVFTRVRSAIAVLGTTGSSCKLNVDGLIAAQVPGSGGTFNSGVQYNPGIDAQIVIGTTGIIQGIEAAITLFAHGAITNKGNLTSNGSVASTVNFYGSTGTLTNSLINDVSGRIANSAGSCIETQNSVPTAVVNKGVMSAATGSFSIDNSGAETTITITNSGLIVGALRLGAGNDKIDTFSGRIVDKASLASNLGAGNDTYIGSNVYADDVAGSIGNDTIYGKGGSDSLDGGLHNDHLFGDAGKDYLDGNLGKDTLTGGTGADTFAFAAASHSPAGTGRDIIADFNHAELDKIDLSFVDANTKIAGPQAFKYIGLSAFHNVAGELHYVLQTGKTIVEADTNGDAKPDLQIELTGSKILVAGDFVL